MNIERVRSRAAAIDVYVILSHKRLLTQDSNIHTISIYKKQHSSPFINMQASTSNPMWLLSRDLTSWKGSDILEARTRWLPVIDARYGGFPDQDQVNGTSTKPIIDENSISSIGGIPPFHVIEQGISFFSIQGERAANKVMYIVRFGYVTSGALKHLASISTSTEFARNFLEMIDWLDERSCKDIDEVFTKSLRQRLLDQADPMKFRFTSSYGVQTSLSSALYLRRETWIDDDVIDAVMKTFKKQYGHRGSFFFVPTQMLSTWIKSINSSKPAFPWNSNRSTILDMLNKGKDGSKDVKAFAVANFESHWGALCVDFTEKIILFGHSLDKRVLTRGSPAVKALKKWLRQCGVSLDDWDYGRMDVAQQDSGSGSCGINALNAIERHFDHRVEFWTNERSRYHRIRYLKLLTESDEVCSFELCFMFVKSMQICRLTSLHFNNRQGQRMNGCKSGEEMHELKASPQLHFNEKSGVSANL